MSEFDDYDDGTYFISDQQARDFLAAHGADSAYIEQVVGEAEEFELQLSTEEQGRRFSITPVIKLPTDDFREMLGQHVGSGLTKQFAFKDLLGEHSWEFDMSSGAIDFGEGRIFPIQIIGTECDKSNSWRWGWANQASQIPLRLLRSAHLLKELGQRCSIEEFRRPQFSCEVWSAHEVALVAMGCCSACCYYRCPYDGGAMYVILEEVPLSMELPTVPARIISVLQAVLKGFAVDHKVMVRSYMQQEGFVIEEVNSHWHCAAQDGRKFDFWFDKDGRLTKFQSSISYT